MTLAIRRNVLVALLCGAGTVAWAQSTRPAGRELAFESGETLLLRDDGRIPTEAAYRAKISLADFPGSVDWGKENILKRADRFSLSPAQRQLIERRQGPIVDMDQPGRGVPAPPGPTTRAGAPNQRKIALWAVSAEDARRTAEAVLDCVDAQRRETYERCRMVLDTTEKIIADAPEEIAAAKKELASIEKTLEDLKALIPVREKSTDRDALADLVVTLERQLRSGLAAPFARDGAPVQLTRQAWEKIDQSVEALRSRIPASRQWDVVTDYIVELQKQFRAIQVEAAGLQAQLAAIEKHRAGGGAMTHLDPLKATLEIELAGALARAKMTEADLKNMTDYYAVHEKQVSMQQTIALKERELTSAQAGLPRRQEEMRKYADWNQPLPVIGAIRIHPIKVEGQP